MCSANFYTGYPEKNAIAIFQIFTQLAINEHRKLNVGDEF
jgi:hypothetical protein